MTEYIIEDILIGTMVALLITLAVGVMALLGTILYEIHPIVLVAFILLWITIVGYMIQTNRHSDIDFLWWVKDNE